MEKISFAYMRINLLKWPSRQNGYSHHSFTVKFVGSNPIWAAICTISKLKQKETQNGHWYPSCNAK